MITAVIIVALNAFASRFGISDLGVLPGHADMAGAVGVFATILVAVQAPELLGRDVRYRVLSLYFSRALLREDYALAKLAALARRSWPAPAARHPHRRGRAAHVGRARGARP